MRSLLCSCVLAACARTTPEQAPPQAVIPERFTVTAREDQVIVIDWRAHAPSAELVSFDAASLAGVVTDAGNGTLLWDPRDAFNHLAEGEEEVYLLPLTLNATNTLLPITAVVTVVGANDITRAAADLGSTNTLDPIGARGGDGGASNMIVGGMAGGGGDARGGGGVYEVALMSTADISANSVTAGAAGQPGSGSPDGATASPGAAGNPNTELY